VRINTAKSEVIDEGALETRAASIDLNPVIAHVLSRDLYQRPVEAVLREVLINAIDAHTEVGIDGVPVILHLPTPLDEVFFVRDFGPGMSHEDVLDIYLTYGASTRRKDNLAHGGLGLGTKSPLAYTDSFTVISRHGGVEREYLIYYNEEGIPQLSHRRSDLTDETGLEVRFTTRQTYEYETFCKAAEAVLPYIPHGRVKIEYDWNVQRPLIITSPVYRSRTDALGLRANLRGAEMVMGYYRYAIDHRALRSLLEDLPHEHRSMCVNHRVGDNSIPVWIQLSEVLDNLTRNNRITFFAAVGDFPVHPSRESVILNRASVKGLAGILKEAVTKIIEEGEPSLSHAVSTYQILHRVVRTPLDEDGKPVKVRAKLLGPCNYSSFTYEHRSGPIRNFQDLVQSIHVTGVKCLLLLSQFDLTDLGKYSVIIFSHENHIKVFHKAINEDTILAVDYESTDASILQELTSSYPQITLPESMLNALRRDDAGTTEEEKAAKGKRHSVRSMQNPTHNVLELQYDRCVYPEQMHYVRNKDYAHGARKMHWESAKHNVGTLLAMRANTRRPIFLVPTNLGITQDERVSATVELVNALGGLLRESQRPILIGLPASRGTKKIEAVFPGMDACMRYMIGRLEAPYLRRRLQLALTADWYLNGRAANVYQIKLYALERYRVHGDVDWMWRLLDLGRRLWYKLKTSDLSASNAFIRHRDRIGEYCKHLPEPLDLDEKVLALHVRFPDTGPESRHPDIPKDGVLINAAHAWATQLAIFEDRFPTGAKYRNEHRNHLS